MKREYDFSKGVRGKFYKKEVELKLPIYLNPKIHRALEKLASKRGKEIDEILGQLVKKELKISR